MVVAETRELALKAADKVKVEYKKSNLAPVLSIEEVMRSAGNRIHVTETKTNGRNHSIFFNGTNYCQKMNQKLK
jgi:CO/xanthine dehydrogenase Mo-binding subunit